MIQRDVVTYFSGFTDHYASAVVDKKAAADGGARVNVDIGQGAAKE